MLEGEYIAFAAKPGVEWFDGLHCFAKSLYYAALQCISYACLHM